MHPGSAFSAGTDVENRGSLVSEWDDPEKNKFVSLATTDGIDIAKSPRTPYDEAAIRGIGRIIVMDLQAVKEMDVRRGAPLAIPGSVEYLEWELPDPHHLGDEESADIRNIIRCKVGALATSRAFLGGYPTSNSVLMPGNP